jgi:glycosidase
MAGSKSVGDGDIRRDFPGGWNGDTNNAFSKSGRNATQEQYFDFTSKLYNWRKNKSVIHSGKMKHYVPENNVYVYFRYNDSETVMVVINNNTEKQTLKLDRFKENIKDHILASEALSNQQINLKEDLVIEGKSALILELK